MGCTKRTIRFPSGGEQLEADLYLPDTSAPAPAVICVHGGGWKGGLRRTYRFLGPYLAEAGYLALAIDYRLVAGSANRHPAALEDVRAAVAYVRAHAAELRVDPARIALMGDSAGGHLIALAGLTDPAGIKVIVPVFGIYDMLAQWESDLVSRPGDGIVDGYLGATPMDDRKLYFEASPISYAVRANNAVAVFLAWGTEDDIVLPAQAERFLLALKQAGFYVRSAVVPAPHYWMGEPLDEPNSFSGFFAPRMLRFLNERL
jgi:acetyl esterase/lipase